MENKSNPKWAIKLGAKIDKFADSGLRMAEVIQVINFMDRNRIQKSAKRLKKQTEYYNLFPTHLYGEGTQQLTKFSNLQKKYDETKIKELHEAMSKPIIKAENVESASETVNKLLGIDKPNTGKPINKINLQRYHEYCLSHGMIPSQTQIKDEIENILSMMNPKQITDVFNYFKEHYDFAMHDRVNKENSEPKPYIGTTSGKESPGEILYQLLTALSAEEIRTIIDGYEKGESNV